MSTNQTPNYGLNQWERTDKIQMDDFNADNAKLDAALAGLAQVTAAHAAELAKRGNCQIATYKYTGNGAHGQANPTVIPFPKGTFILVIISSLGVFHPLMAGLARVDWHESGIGLFYAPITWSATGLSIYSDRYASYQFNSVGVDYTVLSVRMADKL